MHLTQMLFRTITKESKISGRKAHMPDLQSRLKKKTFIGKLISMSSSLRVSIPIIWDLREDGTL